jgi:hypothetical protein
MRSYEVSSPEKEQSESGSPAPIVGKAQKTSGVTHASTSEAIAREFASWKDAAKVFLNKSYKTISNAQEWFGKTRLPDVGVSTAERKITTAEVPSPSDILVAKKGAPSSFDRAIINRNLKAHLQLRDKSEGIFIIGATPKQLSPLIRVLNAIGERSKK